MDKAAERVDPRLVARTVRSYVGHHSVPVSELAGLIVAVKDSLDGVGQSPAAAQPLVPAVPIGRSVQHDHFVCLECGFRSQTLRRHLRVQHGLEVAAYRIRRKLSPSHPLTAPAYSAHRSAMAKEIGLGRRLAATRRGRPRRAPV